MTDTNPNLIAANRPGRGLAIVESALVMIIWGSSFILIKLGLDHVGPLSVAGLRYWLAFLVLLPFAARRRTANGPIARRVWLRLFLIGFSAYAVGNGALFLALQYLSATTGSFLMSFIPVLVLLLSVTWLREIPTRIQIAGIAISLLGSWLFFSDGLGAGEPSGLLIMAVGLCGFGVFSILGREVARDRRVNTLMLTTAPLGFGGGLLLLVALPLEGLPSSDASGWFIVVWLAIVNTALAYILYNHSLQTLTALEMNAMLNLSPLVTAAMAWLLLGDRIEAVQIAGMVVVIAGVLLVQQRGR